MFMIYFFIFSSLNGQTSSVGQLKAFIWFWKKKSSQTNLYKAAIEHLKSQKAGSLVLGEKPLHQYNYIYNWLRNTK